MTSATRDLASHELWERSLERSRRRRVLAEDARRTISRRRNASLAVSAAMATTPVIPSVIASSMSGARKDTKKMRTVTPDTGQRILLKVGAVSPSVATLQRRLGVPDDGYFGPVTQRAVKQFQQRHHLPVTGMVDVKTWLKLFPDGMVIYAPHAGVAQLSARAPQAAIRNASLQGSDNMASLNVSNGASGAAQKAAATTKHTTNADVLPAKGASHKAASAASGAVAHHSSSSAGSSSGSNSGSAPRGNLSGASSMIAAMIAEANRIDAHHYAYSWGGGHNSSFSGPYDCSGAVSAVLHAAGLISRPMVSGEFMHWGAPGPGAVTLYANAGHVYMSILGHYFGTSFANPGGGAGWFSGGPRPGFVVVHVPFSSLHMSKRQLKHWLRMAMMQRASSGGGSSSGGAVASSDPPEQRHIRFVHYQPVTPGYSGQAPGSESSDGGSSASSNGGSSAPSEPSSGVSSGGVSSGGAGYSGSGSSDQQQVSAASTSDQGQNASGASSSAGSSSSAPSYSTNAASSGSGPTSSATESQSSGSGGSYSSGAGSSGSGSSGSGSSGSSGSGSSASEPHAVSRGSAGSGSGGVSHEGSSGSGSYGGGSGSAGSAPSAGSTASQASAAASSEASSAGSAGSGAADSAAGAASSAPAGGGGGGGAAGSGGGSAGGGSAGGGSGSGQ